MTDHSEKLSKDPRFYDAEAAGWWVWGISHWIGGAFGAPLDESNTPDGIPRVHAKDSGGEGVSAQTKTKDKIPAIKGNDTAGVGVSRQRANIPVSDGRPLVNSRRIGGHGVSAQKKNIPVPDFRPFVVPTNTSGVGVSRQRENIPMPGPRPVAIGKSIGGLGVSSQRKTFPVTDGIPAVCGSGNWAPGVSHQRATRPALVAWFHALQARLQRVIVINRDWKSALTKPMLMGHRPNTQVGILLDPPYRLGERSTLYAHEDGDCPAEESWAWALEHGNRYCLLYTSPSPRDS